MNRSTAILATIAVIAAGLLGAADGAEAAEASSQPKLFAACPTEDSVRCVWHAPSRGDGEGRSLWTDARGGDGGVHYVSHATARALLAARGDWQRVPRRLVGERVDMVGRGSFIVGKGARIAYGGTTYIRTRGGKVGTS